ncbi:uncharacterized protein ARMOST_10862 [Armillaria ostoyae]|uniref:Uncharacterized protein n=1 Tax=Armillaria ostoyae TaxID=47428 RepID=A0A284RFI6_ARMOS|nr:uncharacterized protein ARMOST_10862 [Armillaria ostoyae]
MTEPEKNGSEAVSEVNFNTDAQEDRRLVRKVDLRLIPILTLLYLLSFLDRSNIGNARIIGLATGIHLSPPAYNTALALYFIAYVIFEVPSNLNDDERSRLLARLKADSDAGHDERFKWFYVRQAISDHLVWGYAFLFHGFSFVLYTLSLFMPTIIVGLGFGSWQAQLMTVPPNALASISIWLTVWLSSKCNLRAPFIIASAIVAIIAGGQYTGVHFAAAGVYTGNALLLSWPGENVSGQTKRAIAVAMQITIGDLGAVAGVLIYRPEFASHNFRKPHIISIGYLLFAIAVTVYLWVWMSKENRQRALSLENKDLHKEIELSEEERLKLGDRDVNYRYVL